MQQFRKILVGVDLSAGDRIAAEELSAPTREAVRRAVWLAEQLSAELTFFAVLEISLQAEELLHDEFKEATRSVEEAANADLARLVADAKAAGVEASAKVEFGRAWEAIIQQVLRNGHDLVIVGTRDVSAASRFLFGSTGMKLLRNCPCPVWVTRPDPDWDDLNMLVASDLSDVSQRALDIAVNGAQLTGARVHVLHVVEDHFKGRLWLTGMSDANIEAFRARQLVEAEQDLQEQLARTDYRTLAGVQVHVVEGSPESAILDAIEQFDIDLLVMGTVARSGIPGLLIGNTAERLLAHVPCSVLAIKPADFECPVKLDD